MGYIVKATCHTCGYSQEFKLGQGRQSGELAQVLQCFCDKDQESIKEYMKEGVLTFTLDRELAYCKTCNMLHIKYMLIIYTKADHVYNIEGKCKICSSDMTTLSTSENEQDLLCMNCRKNKLALVNNGLWD